MNRKLSFRAFHKPTKRYFEVDTFNEGEVMPELPQGLTDYEFDLLNNKPYRRADCIMLQFTGLPDKLGIGIWEGDILRDDVHYDADMQARGNVDYSSYCQVLYEEGGFILKFLADDDTHVISEYVNSSQGCVSLIRVSNPFEHPELLKLTNADYPVVVPSPYNRSGGPQHVEPVTVSRVVPLYPNGLDFRVYHKPSKNFYIGITLHHEGVQVTNEEQDTLPDLPFDDCILLPFTGAVDYTGRKIYEGDIYMHLSIDKEMVDAAWVEVVTNKGCAYGFQTTASGEFFPFCEPGMNTDGPYYSWLGNRFENPGLLDIKQWDAPGALCAINETMCDYNLPVMVQLHPYGPEQLKQYAVAFNEEHNRFTTSGQQVA